MKKSFFGRLTALVLAGFLSISSFQIISAYAAPTPIATGTIPLGASSIGTVTGQITDATATKGKQTVFHHSIGNNLIADDSTTAIKGFDLDQDWLVLVPPTIGTLPTLEISADPTNTKIVIKAGNAVTRFSILSLVNDFYLQGNPVSVTPANVNVILEHLKTRIIASNTPIIRSVTVDNTKVEQGGLVKATAFINFFDASDVKPNYQLGVSVTDQKGMPITKEVTVVNNVITIDTKSLEPATYTYYVAAQNISPVSGIMQPFQSFTKYPFTFTVTKCTAVLEKPVITPILSNNTINVTNLNSFQFTAAVAFNKNHQNCGGTHIGGETHDKSIFFGWSATGLNANIVLDQATGKFTINKENLAAGTYSITLTCTAIAKAMDNTTTTTESNYTFTIVKDAPPTPPTRPDDSDDHGKEQEMREDQWKDINKKVSKANSKDTIHADLRLNPNAPARFWDNLRGRNVNVEFYMGSNYTWHINGTNLKPLPANQIYIPLGVETISDAKISKLAKHHDVKMFELEYNGSFYGTLQLETTVSSDYRGKNLYLYKYNPEKHSLIYKGSAKVRSDNTVLFPFTSASTYVITEKALYGETATGSTSSKPTVAVSSSSSIVPSSSSSISSSSSSSSTSTEPSSSISSTPSSSSSQSTAESSKPTDVTPTEPEKTKKNIPIIIPILLVAIVITLVAVFVLTNNNRGV